MQHLRDLPANVASKGLIGRLTRLDATLTKNRGRGRRLWLTNIDLGLSPSWQWAVSPVLVHNRWCILVQTDVNSLHEDSGKICPSERIAARKNRCTGPQPGQDAQAQLQSHARRADRKRHRSRKAQTAGVLRIGRAFSQSHRTGRSQEPRRRLGPHGIRELMPTIAGWADLPPNVRQHLLDRMP